MVKHNLENSNSINLLSYSLDSSSFIEVTEKQLPMITVEAPRDGCAIPYPLLFIEGFLKDSLCDTITVSNIATGSKTTWPVLSNRFKCFVLLISGCNTVKLQHGYFTKTIEVSRNTDDAGARTNYLIQPLYVIFKDSDGVFQSPKGSRHSLDSALDRISLACALLQTYTAVNIGTLLGIEPRFTFQFNYDLTSCLPRCETFNSKYSTQDINQLGEAEIWKLLAKELMDSDLPHLHTTKYIMFLSNTRYDGQKWEPSWRHRDIVAATEGYIAIGGGGLAVLSTATLHTWAERLEDLVHCLTDDTTVDKRYSMDDSAYRGTYWANYATGLGALLHELGHTLDLSHTSSGIMARGDDIHTFFVLHGAKQVVEEMPYDSLEAKLAELHADTKERITRTSVNTGPSSDLILIPNLRPSSTLSVPEPTPPTLRHLNKVKLESPTSYHPNDSHTESEKTCTSTDFSNWDLSSAVMLRYSRWLLPPLELQQSHSKPCGTYGHVEAEAGVRTVQIYCRCIDVIVESHHYLKDPPPRVVHPVQLTGYIQHKPDCSRGGACLEAHIRDSAGNILKVKQN